MSKNLLKEAEQNVINVCKEFEMAIDYADALSRFGNTYFDDYDPGKEKFFNGLVTMRDGLYLQFTNRILRAFMFSGIGGEKAQEYARQKFAEHFDSDTRYVVSNFLSKYGTLSERTSVLEVERFREEAKEKLNELG